MLDEPLVSAWGVGWGCRGIKGHIGVYRGMKGYYIRLFRGRKGYVEV